MGNQGGVLCLTWRSKHLTFCCAGYLEPLLRQPMWSTSKEGFFISDRPRCSYRRGVDADRFAAVRHAVRGGRRGPQTGRLPEVRYVFKS